MSLDEFIQSGNGAIKNRDWDGAYQSWMKVWEQEPTHAWVKVKLGKILLELNRFEEAEKLLAEDVEAYPNRPYALVHLAKIAQTKGLWSLAQERLESLLNHFPNYEWALFPYAETLKHLGELDKAERFYHMDVAVHSGHFRSHLALIEIALMKEQFQLAQRRIDYFVIQYPKKAAVIDEFRASMKARLNNTKLEDYINFDTWDKSKWRFRLSNQSQFLYCPIPKVASSTVAMSLYKVTQGKRPPKGLSGKDISNTFANQDIPNEILISQLKSALVCRDSFSFTIVRNPYTRILSAYLDKIQKSHVVDYRTPLGFRPVSEEEVTFIEFLKRIRYADVSQLNPHFSPQWYLLGLDKLMKFDFVGRFENLDEDLQYILNRIDKKRPDKKIISRRPHATNAAEKIRRYYGVEEQALVAEIYADDFKLLGYGQALPLP